MALVPYEAFQRLGVKRSRRGHHQLRELRAYESEMTCRVLRELA
jgi:hypothetical protein